MDMRAACSTLWFREASIDVALESICQAGFTAIDLALLPNVCDHFDPAAQSGAEREDFVSLVRNTGLRVPAVTAAPGNFASPDDNFDFILQSALAYLKLAAQLGSDGLNLDCGLCDLPPVQGAGPAGAVTSGLREIAREAAQLGLCVNVDIPPSAWPDRAREILRLIGQDNVRLVLDARAAGEPIVALARAFGGRIGHVRVPGGTELQGCRALFNALRTAGYRGHYSLQPQAGAAEPAGGHDLRKMRESLEAEITAASAPVSAGR